ncbi:MAG: proteasome-activating nucleotidase [Promethearchaeota archaeon]
MGASETANRFRYPEREDIILYLQYLEKRVRTICDEINSLKTQVSQLKFELRTLKPDVERFGELPLIKGSIISILDNNNERAIVNYPPKSIYVVGVSTMLQNEKLSPGLSVALSNLNFTVVEILPTDIEPFIKGMEIMNPPFDISYDDVGGLDEQIQEVREILELPLKKPEIFEKIGIEPPKGVLFYGEPGTGKTLLAKAIAHETNSTFIRVTGAELVDKFIGEGARFVREIFALARERAPAIIFIDELDAIGSIRMDDAISGEREVNRTLMQLLSELDGFDQRGNIKFIGATNRSDILDPALLRSGRFDRKVEFPLPNERGRENIFKIHMKNLKIEDEVNLKSLVALTKDTNGADIKGICIEAGMYAIRRNSDKISRDDFIKAISKIISMKNKDHCDSTLFI